MDSSFIWSVPGWEVKVLGAFNVYLNTKIRYIKYK